MKSILLFLLLAFGAAAQSYTYKIQSFINGNLGPMNGVPGDLFMSTITFSNASNAPIQVFVDRYQKNIAPYWAVCYCYIQCHSPAEDTVTVDIQPFSTTDVTVQFKTDSVNPGISTVSFKTYQKGLAAITQSVDMTATTMGALGMPKIMSTTGFDLYPNPASKTIFLQSGSMISLLRVFDITGSLKHSEATNSEKTELQISDYPPGVYFVEIISKEIICLKKFIKQ